MAAVALFVLSLVFAYLAYDAWRLSVPAQELPYEVLSREPAANLQGVPRVELERRKQWQIRYGEGDLGQAYWFWVIASVGCVCAAVWSLFE